MPKWMIVALVFVLAVEVLVLVELLVPRKYKKPVRLVLMPVIWIVSSATRDGGGSHSRNYSGNNIFWLPSI